MKKGIFVALIASAFATNAAAGDVNKHDDIQWAVADGKPLTLDIYAPKSASGPVPVVVIYHGGGWLINDNSIMDSMSQYLAEEGGYVVANVNYRLLSDNGNTTTMDEIVEDAFGGLLWVKANIASYGGDPSQVAITGDSAGGHLAAMVLTAGRDLESDGFKGKSLGFRPTWLPKGKTAEDIAKEDGLAVQAAVISYGAFDLHAAAGRGFESSKNVFWQFAKVKPRGIFGEGITVNSHPGHYKAVSPLFNIPKAAHYKLPPQFHHVGSEDKTTPPEAIKAFVSKLQDAGQPAELKVYPGFNHAYLDSGCLEVFKSCFQSHAVPVLKDILPFLKRVFTENPKQESEKALDPKLR